LKDILPGPKHEQIDYKQPNQKVLEGFDNKDLNPEVTGGSIEILYLF
jgi:hypothetical protein